LLPKIHLDLKDYKSRLDQFIERINSGDQVAKKTLDAYVSNGDVDENSVDYVNSKLTGEQLNFDTLVQKPVIVQKTTEGYTVLEGNERVKKAQEKGGNVQTFIPSSEAIE